MSTVIEYGDNHFVVEEMTQRDKEQLKSDNEELYNKFFNSDVTEKVVNNDTTTIE